MLGDQKEAALLPLKSDFQQHQYVAVFVLQQENIKKRLSGLGTHKLQK